MPRPSGVVILAPGADNRHPWVDAFTAALGRLLPVRFSDVGVQPASTGCAIHGNTSPMAPVYFQRSRLAGTKRRERSGEVLAGLPPNWARLQLYTNDCLADDGYFLFTDVLLATIADHAHEIPGYEWPAELLQDALARELDVLHAARLIFVPSRWLETWIQGRMSKTVAQKVRRVGWGPGIDLRSVGQNRIRSLHGRNFQALFVGYASDRKGLALVLEAMPALRARVPDARLLVVGAPLDVSIPGVKTLGELDVKTSSGRGLLRSAYATSSLFVMPASFEPVGCAFIEAMQAGLPVIARPVCAVPELVIQDRTGWHVRCLEDVEAAMIEAATDHAVRNARGSAAWEHASDYYTWERVASAILTAIRKDAR